jgi:hypothetical protein
MRCWGGNHRSSCWHLQHVGLVHVGAVRVNRDRSPVGFGFGEEDEHVGHAIGSAGVNLAPAQTLEVRPGVLRIAASVGLGDRHVAVPLQGDQHVDGVGRPAGVDQQVGLVVANLDEAGFAPVGTPTVFENPALLVVVVQNFRIPRPSLVEGLCLAKVFFH